MKDSFLQIGTQIPDFFYNTPYENALSFHSALAKVSGKTAIIFLRFYGCRLSQYDIMQYAKNYAKIVGTDAQFLVVLQSKAEIIMEALQGEKLPFEFICDPDSKLYKLFHVVPGLSEESVLHDTKSAEKIEVAVAAGIVKGEPEGEHLQLPATFVVDRNHVLTYAYYGVSGADTLSPEQLHTVLHD